MSLGMAEPRKLVEQLPGLGPYVSLAPGYRSALSGLSDRMEAGAKECGGMLRNETAQCRGRPRRAGVAREQQLVTTRRYAL